MGLAITPASAEELAPWRERREAETPGPFVQDRTHQREGWSQGYLLREDGVAVGYGSLLVGHIWKGQRLIFQFYLDPRYRNRADEIFQALAAASQATGVRGKTDDVQLAPFLARAGGDLWIEKLLFRDQTITGFPAPNCRFRPLRKDEAGRVFEHKREPIGDWALERDGRVVATGSCPSQPGQRFGELSYEVAEPFRRQGLGTYLVQELKRTTRESGAIPCARCDPDNEASRRTLLRAGFVVCGDLRTEKFGR
ncbi:MAG TPA: GNAT family N-acetyltransferase [Opitutaceae bacterium]|jgi:GNAT superfamily N-acetyltransferase|nr:GNAT family N-acetyltransferase [Opitutaceae bacterium]